MQLDTGLGGGFALASWPGAQGTAAGASPQGPTTAAGAGFGVTAGGGGVEAQSTAVTTGFLSIGTLALLGLLFVWWSLPA
jgi:hypothetical protein